MPVCTRPAHCVSAPFCRSSAPARPLRGTERAEVDDRPAVRDPQLQGLRRVHRLQLERLSLGVDSADDADRVAPGRAL